MTPPLTFNYDYYCGAVRHGHCLRGSRCENGLRSRNYYILSGSVLSVWTNVERAVASRMQIMRLRTSDGKKIVGKYIQQPGLQKFTIN